MLEVLLISAIIVAITALATRALPSLYFAISCDVFVITVDELAPLFDNTGPA